MKYDADDVTNSSNALRDIFPAGATVPVIRFATSQSGMTHRVMVLAPSSYGAGIRRVSWDVARATGMRYDDRTGCVIVTGAGLDIGHHLVDVLARHLYGDGRALSHQTI